MTKVALYIAATLDGRIASPDGGVEWLDRIPNPDGSDFGYADFYAEVGAAVMGASTYRQIAGWEIPFPYADKPCYVFTRQAGPDSDAHATFVREAPELFVPKLKAKTKGLIWLVGGGELNAAFLAANLVDELRLFVMPYALGEGRPLFGPGFGGRLFRLLDSRAHPGGALELRYAPEPPSAEQA